MKRRAPRRQRGIALLALLAILVIGGTWYLVTRMQQVSANRTAAERTRNAQVLNKAKQALIGYVIAQANHANENNPGALPCPEAPTSFNATNGTDGKMASSCTLPAVGRFPWRSIGADKMVDAAGEPLWYVVSPGWAYTGSSTVINSNSTGQLTVDGVAPASLPAADTVIALIIAPGLAFSVPAATGCTAWNQTRPATSGVAPDVRNYLECDNASSGDSSFVTAGPSGSFNDQVIKVTVGDLMPGLEAAVADRLQRSGEFFDTLKTVYAGGTWGIGGANSMYPFAATFTDPSTTAAAQGAVGTYAGLLPVTYAETSPGSGVACTASASAPRCAPSFVAWSGTPTASGPALYSPDCTATTPTLLNCTVSYRCPIFSCLFGGSATLSFTINATAANVGMALRRLNSATPMTNVDAAGRSATGTMNSNGSAAITLNGTTTVNYTSTGLVNMALCSLLNTFTYGCESVTISVPILLLADHSILDTTTTASYGWFLRNKWNEVTYYAVAQNYSPTVLPGQPACTNGTTCLSVTNPPSSGGAAGTQRSIAILMGRSINGSTRPSTTLADYLEFGNVGGAYEGQSVRDSVRNVLADSGVANAYAVSLSSVSVGTPIYFKAANTNTGASTLSTAATGARSLVNADGTSLSGSQIRANNALLVTYDGAQFVLATKRPFNDRVIVIDHN